MQRQSRLFASALVLFAAFAVTPSSPATADDDENGSVVGSWIGTLTFKTPPGLKGATFTILANFNRDGTLTGNDGTARSSQLPPELCPAPCPFAVDRGDYFGSWVPIGDSNQIALTFKQLLFAGRNTHTALYGTFFYPGQNIGLGTVQAIDVLEHTKNSDRLTGDFTGQNTRLPPPLGDGSLVVAASGTVSFSRVAIEPLMR